MASPDQYRKIFISINGPHPAANLEGRIKVRIARARTVKNRVHISLHGAVAAGSIALLITAIQYTSAEASHTGFYSYISLLVSDGRYLASSWKELSITILESAPIMGVTLSIGTLAILANALRRGARYVAPSTTRPLIYS